ncbi:flagellar assembly protein T N-terminal domain-containing protein, partial [Escherichia coli]|nr:flagellar assembly protein T N-terminal domain-containing protein [Escherichia coli]
MEQFLLFFVCPTKKTPPNFTEIDIAIFIPERSYSMERILFSLLSITFVMLLPFRAVASWYEVTGVATIVSYEDAARLHALEDALFKAVNFSGADIG